MIGFLLIVLPVACFFFSFIVGMVAIDQNPRGRLATICSWILLGAFSWIVIIALFAMTLAVFHVGGAP